MKKELKPGRTISGRLKLPGDKSIAHRAALFSVLAEEPITIRNFPENEDCLSSLKAAETTGVKIDRKNNEIVLTPSEKKYDPNSDLMIDCGNSGTTARLFSGMAAGSDMTVILSGDESLSSRPMQRIVDPLTEMGAELFSDEGHLPIKVRGKKLLPFEYRMPVASAQVKSSILLAGIASGCSVTIREDSITRNHTELMLQEIGEGLEVRRIKAVMMDDPLDPRKKKLQRPEDFKVEINLAARSKIRGGLIDIPGDISTAAFFFGAAALTGGTVTIENLGLNPTRTGILDYLKVIGCKVSITDKVTLSGELRGTVTVTGDRIKARKISGETTVRLIDEIPIVAVIASKGEGTTLIRDARELRVKESDRLQAIAENLSAMGIKCGLLEDGIAIEGKNELGGADFILVHGIPLEEMLRKQIQGRT